MKAIKIGKKIGKEIAKPFKGWSAEVYLCPAGYPTIGWGHRTDTKHPPITRAEGEAYLSQDMGKALAGTLKYCPVLAAYPETLGAIADFTFNLGVGRLQASTLRMRINQRDWPEVVRELGKWVYGGGKSCLGWF